MTRRALLILFCLAAIVAAFWRVTPCPAQPTPLRIGEIDPLSGKLAMHGIEIHQGILYAVEEVNSRGGVAGRRVELIARDDQSQPEVAMNQAQNLVLKERVVGLVGGYVDASVGPIREIAGRHRVPYVAAASLQGALTRDGRNPFFFRVARLDGIAQPICRFLVEELAPQRVAILYAATPGSTEFAELVKACLEKAAITIAVFDKFRPGSSDFSSLLLKLRQLGVDVLVSGGFYPDHLVLIRQLREYAIPLKGYVAPWGVAYQSFVREMGAMSEGIFGTCAWNPGITLPGTEGLSQSFVDGFRQRFGQAPNTTTMHGYAAARALLAAAERVFAGRGELTGDALRRQLAELDLTLPMERVKFDGHGDPEFYEHVIVQIQQGDMVVVSPPARATGKARYPMEQPQS
jgi:branched-chain amino acid transport system substrate-binding protein